MQSLYALSRFHSALSNLTGHSRTARLAAIFALLALFSAAPAAEESVGTAAAGDAHRLRWAMDACDAANWSTLRLCLVDPSPSVRLLAVSCWDPVVAGLLAPRVAVTDVDPAVRRAAACLYASSGSSDELDALLGDTDPSVRAMAVSCLPISDEEAFVAAARKLLNEDDEPEVISAAALWLVTADAVAMLSEDEARLLEIGLQWASVLENTPELAGGLLSLQDEVSRLLLQIEPRSEEGDVCAQAAIDGLRALSDEISEISRIVDAKAGDPWELLVASRRRLAQVMQGQYACESATPITFSSSGFFAGWQGRTLSAISEMGVAWDINFGPLRADIEEVDRGELWTRFNLGVNAYWPGRAVGDSTPDSPAVAVAGRLRRDQLFVNESLSRWNGGGFARFHLPFPLGSRRSHVLKTTVFGLHSTGDNEDYPDLLVTPHDRFGAAADLRFELRPSVAMGVHAAASRVRYEEERFEAAGADEVELGFHVDTAYQLQLEGAWRQYAATGPTDGLTATPGATNRDGAVLSGMTGVRFSGPGDLEFIELYVLGGVGLPVLPSFDPDVSPQVLFDLRLEMRSEPQSGEFFRLSIGGLRRFDYSPRNFATQTVVESFIELAGGVLDPKQSGVEGVFRTYYSLTDHLGAMTDELEQRYNVIGGVLGARWYVLEWLGFHVYDQLEAVKLLEQDFQVNNRFFLSFFVPMGGYAFDREEPLSW